MTLHAFDLLSDRASTGDPIPRTTTSRRELRPGTDYLTIVWDEPEAAPTPHYREPAPTWYGYGPEEDGHDTATTSQATLLVLLQGCAEVGDYEVFAHITANTDWSVRSPDQLATVIDLALSLDMASLAMDLAQKGADLFPGNQRLQRAASVLAPPVPRVVPTPEARGLDASRTWVSDHAAEYRGQWVAVREGQLLGAAGTLAELRTLIAQGQDAASTIVTNSPIEANTPSCFFLPLGL